MSEDYLEWLKQLIKENKLEKFYHDSEWLKVKAQVRKLDHNECQQCRREGRMTLYHDEDKRRQMSVHHKKPVRKYPELALSIFYVDENGQKKRNLELICESCHNKEHKKFKKESRTTNRKKFVNEEKW